MSTPLVTRRPPAPVTSPESELWWQAADRGELLVRFCHDCDGHHHYPRTICPLCGSDNTDWRVGSGLGSVYAYSILRRGPGTPFALGYVELDEGVLMLTNFIDIAAEHLAIGQRVRVVFVESAGGHRVPMFAPERSLHA